MRAAELNGYKHRLFEMDTDLNGDAEYNDLPRINTHVCRLVPADQTFEVRGQVGKSDIEVTITPAAAAA